MRIVATSDVSWARRWEHTASSFLIERLVGTDSLIIREIRKDRLLWSLLSSNALRSVHGIISGRGADRPPHCCTLTILAHLHLEALILRQMWITARHWSSIMQILV